MLPSRLVRSARRLSLLVGNRLPGSTADVSAGGFSLEAPFVFMPGSVLHGTFEVAGRELPFRGEPLPAADDAFAGEWAMAFRMLKNAAIAPPWIEADKDARAGLLYDVVNRKGELVERVQLPKDRTLVGFGSNGDIYMQHVHSPTRASLERASVLRPVVP